MQSLRNSRKARETHELSGSLRSGAPGSVSLPQVQGTGRGRVEEARTREGRGGEWEGTPEGEAS